MKQLVVAMLGTLLSGCALFGAGSQAPVLTDVEWQVSQLAGEPVLADSRVTLRFSSDGRVSGKASCNGFSGSYEQTEDQALNIGQLVQTKRMCMPRELMQQEARFLSLLSQVRAYTFDGDQLRLQSAEEAEIVASSASPD